MSIVESPNPAELTVEDVLNDYTLYVGGNLKIDVVGNINFSHCGNLNIYEAATSDDIERK